MDERPQNVLIQKFDEKGNLRSEWLVSEIAWHEADLLCEIARLHLCSIRDIGVQPYTFHSIRQLKRRQRIE